MKDLKVSIHGDLDFLSEDIVMVEEIGELCQTINLILSVRQGEFSLDQDIGLIWDNLIGKNFNEDYLTEDISQTILEQEPRINQVDEVSFVTENRFLKIDVKMTSTNGDHLTEEVLLNAE